MRVTLLLFFMWCAAAALADTTVVLQPPAPAYPKLLGHSCGGVRTSTFAVGFDRDGNIRGLVHAWTRCDAGGGRAHRTKTFSSWHSLVWDTSGQLLASEPNTAPSAPDPSFTMSDHEGRTISTRPKTPESSEYTAVLTTP
jgi:hypothetical protein